MHVGAVFATSDKPGAILLRPLRFANGMLDVNYRNTICTLGSAKVLEGRAIGSGKANSEMKEPIYLDYNATTPHDPEVVVAMRPYLEKHFGNPSSSHWYGIRTRNAVESAQGQVASLLNCQPDDIVFTSGGTESNNHAIKGAAFALRDKGNHIITTQTEHPAVTEVCKFLEEHGFNVTYLSVDESGQVSVSDIEKAITPLTILITIMHANNEVGTIQPIEQVSKLARERGILMHTDAAQSVGKIPTDVSTLGVDLLSVAGHKLYAPKGIGALYIRKGTQLAQFIHGAGQERGQRAGTENVLAIVGLGKACEVAKQDLEKNISHMKAMRDRLHNGLRDKLRDIKLNGHPEMRLPNTLSLSFLAMDANMLLSEIKDYVAASAGAACHSGGVEISYILKAMNVPTEWAKGTVRFSTGRMTTEADVERAINIISHAVIKLEDKQSNDEGSP
ncbi:MAG: cysteine desulfurase family protein [Planctomycetota bacterium]|jgi:cysteine desulfurase